ncbi:hypothetical protein KSP40_PGU022828 [Platanthera guangdongensis]|uniref:Uncharacterized protein n=1 Tax=Platanthera guangdongensis TaxID=2320717 RepID=A0ABR2LYJ0_9ASPA
MSSRTEKDGMRTSSETRSLIVTARYKREKPSGGGTIARGMGFLCMNYTVISDDIIVGSQPQKPEDIYHLMEEKVAYILSLQQDKDIEYWDIDIDAIVKICNKLGIRHVRRPFRISLALI